MSAFTTQQKVRFGHVDPAGIAYFPRIYDYIHEAFEELWEIHVGVRYYALLGEQRIGFPLVHSEVDFRHPLRFGDRPTVRVTCFRLGRSSLGLRYVYKLDDVVCVDARMTTACIELDTMKSIPMPPQFRSRFEQIMEPHEEMPA
jgi:4-hydroxybenzoyl-CoA thioesterase